jgi:hypothetical protein
MCLYKSQMHLPSVAVFVSLYYLYSSILLCVFHFSDLGMVCSDSAPFSGYKYKYLYLYKYKYCNRPNTNFHLCCRKCTCTCTVRAYNRSTVPGAWTPPLEKTLKRYNDQTPLLFLSYLPACSISILPVVVDLERIKRRHAQGPILTATGWRQYSTSTQLSRECYRKLQYPRSGVLST